MSDQHLHNILDDKTLVVGEIYIITNITNNKQYVGQTLSHRLNHGKYRPFGNIGRFKDHISEALCNNKVKQCRYLNNAIRKNGRESFKVELIERCDIQQLDAKEQEHISKFNSLFPNGYNLTKGGKTLWKVEFIDTSDNKETIKQPKDTSRSETTKQLISQRLQERFENSPELKVARMQKAKAQHLRSKLLRYKDIILTTDNLEQYLYPVYRKKDNSIKLYKVNIEGIVTRFHGKHCPIEDVKKDALEFLNALKNKN